MKEIVKKLTKLASSDRAVLKALKRIAVEKQEYDLAANLRNIEVKQYPKSHTHSKEYSEARNFQVALRSVGLNSSAKYAYRALKVAEEYIKEGGIISTKKSAEIENESDEIFGADELL